MGFATIRIAEPIVGPTIYSEVWSALTPPVDFWNIVSNGGASTSVKVEVENDGLRAAFLRTPNATDGIALNGVVPVSMMSGAVLDRYKYLKTVMEFQAQFTNPTRYDFTKTFMGFAYQFTDLNTIDGTRTGTNLFGFAFDSLQVLSTLTQVSTTAFTLTNVPAAVRPTLTVMNLYRIEIYSSSGTPTVDFYVNDVLANSHTANLPFTSTNVDFYPAFTAWNLNTGGGGSRIDVGPLDIYYTP